jgi:hypothetical protein
MLLGEERFLQNCDSWASNFFILSIFSNIVVTRPRIFLRDSMSF